MNDHEEFDNTIREAEFAFHSVDLKSWNSSSSNRNSGRSTQIDPVEIRHLALVIHFKRGPGKPPVPMTIVFEAWKDKDTGLLQAGIGKASDEDIFKKGVYLGSINTSPRQLFNWAKEVKGIGQEYSLGLLGQSNNCQTFVLRFLAKISDDLSETLKKKVPGAEISEIIN